MPELDWFEDSDTIKHVDANYRDGDFLVSIRIGIETENGDHPTIIAVEHFHDDRGGLSAEIDMNRMDLGSAKGIAKKVATLLVEEMRAAYEAEAE